MGSDRNSETLLHSFGSTPLVTETLIEGLHLAYWFQTNDPIGGLSWTKVCPTLIIQAITLANDRAKKEGLTFTWKNLWASAAHARRMLTGNARSTTTESSDRLPSSGKRSALHFHPKVGR